MTITTLYIMTTDYETVERVQREHQHDDVYVNQCGDVWSIEITVWE